MKHFNSIHDMTSSPEYSSWLNMKQRCTNPNNEKYHRYGGRGISICDAWMRSFVNFFNDMGERPSKNHSIDRIDNDGDYCPENCKWSDVKAQANNRSTNHIISLNGNEKTISEWAKDLDISEDVIFARKKLGWSDEETLTLPLHQRRFKGRGVTMEKRKNGTIRWKAYAYKNNKRIHLGVFDTESEALAERLKYESSRA